MRRDRRFVGYAFSVGDIFLELDADGRISDIEGALGWIGFDSADAALGKTFSDLIAPEDRESFEAAADLCRRSGRYGPVRLAFGADGKRRQRFGLFLAQLSDAGAGLLIVAVAASRLDGTASSEPVQLGEKEQFLEHLPETVRNLGREGDVALSLFALEDTSSESRSSFGRRLASLSLGGNTAAEIGDGRFAILHEGARESGEGLSKALRAATGSAFQSTTLPAGEAELQSADAARAVVYAIRKFAENSPGFDLGSLASGYDSMLEETRRHIVQLRNIINERRFKLAFQPIVDLKTRKAMHYEALVRFDMRGGSPYELIAFAEQAGLIDEFDSVILGSVSRKLMRARSRGEDLQIAANVSARSLASPAFMDTLLAHLTRQSELAGGLLFEITESAKLENLEALGQALRGIRDLGFRVCLDDFGAGASGFQYLRDLQVDIVKIDGSYVRDAETDPRCRAFVHAMVTLCKGLGIKTVGEWVESESQARLLSRLGVDYGQGYLFGHPRVSLPHAGAETPLRHAM